MSSGWLADRPVFIGIAAGDQFFGSDVRQPDSITPYLTGILHYTGLKTPHFLPLQGTTFCDDTDIAVTRDTLVNGIDHDMIESVRDRPA